MKILLLGGTGFVGPPLVRALASHSGEAHDIRILHRGRHDFPEPLPPNVRRICADTADLRLYQEALRTLQFDIVVHMLAMTRHDARLAIEIFAGHAGRLVVASSQDVYAAFGALLRKPEESALEPSSAPITEAGPLRTSRYIRGGDYEKLDVEETFLERAESLPVTILRMPATYGPGDSRHRFFPYIKRFEDRRPAILLEPAFGNFRWTHAYVENVAHAFTLAITHPGPPPRSIYNIGEPQTPTFGERLHELARVAGYRGRIVVVPRDRCPAHLVKEADFRHDVVVSDAALRQDLGFREIVSTEEGLRRTVEWQRTICPVEIAPADFDYAAEDDFLRSAGLP